ncbi:phosphoglycerate mutase [Streptomyces spiroverticillatus]|uniref:Phosphoglycerate mutase n=1 Tax=Streptomyces finlayi TaxID=67296 RepID=A0A919C7T9_9ACTN|nr:histidine phosphatase family protein [Streptomyces finlayi]GGZ97055.1 phosphoglycerate mutase [Streptomyces spiroverticillatus]GHC82281.1 phosphoglycerate mutase [Streptomyces finlayi]
MKTAPRHLYIARHAQATPDESGLSETGRRQAALLGERLRSVRFDAIHHGPLPRAAETARLVADRLEHAVLPQVTAAAGDFVPYEPVREDFPEGIDADRYLNFVAQFPPEEREQGPELAARAIELLTGPADEPRRELVVTHNFLAAWFVREALQAPAWRWLGLNLANAALTVIRYEAGRPDTVLVLNDMAHLPPELREFDV